MLAQNALAQNAQEEAGWQRAIMAPVGITTTGTTSPGYTLVTNSAPAVSYAASALVNA